MRKIQTLLCGVRGLFTGVSGIYKEDREKPAGNFDVWRTIKMGTHKDADSLRHALETTGCFTSDYADDIIGKIRLSSEEWEIKLAVCSAADLGFKKGGKYKDICKEARGLGLRLCPSETGPQLRLQYQDQPRGEWLAIAMNPIADSEDGFDIFDLGHPNSERWLTARYGYPDGFWLAENRFVFWKE